MPLTPTPFVGAKLLIADDNRVLRSAYAVLLRRSGYRVLEASDGMEAVELWNRDGQRLLTTNPAIEPLPSAEVRALMGLVTIRLSRMTIIPRSLLVRINRPTPCRSFKIASGSEYSVNGSPPRSSINSSFASISG